MGGSQGEWMPFRPGSEACGSVFCRQWPENIVPDGELVGAKFGRLPEKSLSLPIRGEVLEWLKRRAWKARIRLKRIRGSNPLLSANDREVGWVQTIFVCNLFAFRRQRIYSERFGIVRSADGRRPGIGRDMRLFGRSREGGPQLDLCLVCRKLGKVIIRGFEIDYPVTDEMFARPE